MLTLVKLITVADKDANANADTNAYVSRSANNTELNDLFEKIEVHLSDDMKAVIKHSKSGWK